MKLSPRRSMLCLLLLALLSSPCGRTFAQSAPLDLWSSETQLRIRAQEHVELQYHCADRLF
jgi:hypothetical protein